jgi:hypothetical protein
MSRFSHRPVILQNFTFPQQLLFSGKALHRTVSSPPFLKAYSQKDMASEPL